MHVTAVGFDNEDDMVKGLAATNRSQSQTCFTHGAGMSMAQLSCDRSFPHAGLSICMHMHIHEQALYLIIYIEPELSTLFV